MVYNNRRLALLATIVLVAIPLVLAHRVDHGGKLGDRILNEKHHGHTLQQDSFQQWAFSKLFPFSARWNSVLATFYISSFPNFILALVPTELDPASLNTMIAFATGGLLGDVCMHLIPHSFMGESETSAGTVIDGVRYVLVEEKRNVIIGGAIFGGFFAFYFLDKTMRVLNSSPDDSSAGGHSHGHHHHNHAPFQAEAKSTALDTSNSSEGLRQRNKEKTDDVVAPIEEKKEKEVSASLRLSAYLNLFGDFTHNITDGLAMAASFYASPQLGAISTFATFCHEIPHEASSIADYSILIKSGFTKRQAMTSQFITAIGAFVGTFLGIWIAESAGAGGVGEKDAAGLLAARTAGFLGTSVRPSDLVIPGTAGGFLYIASVSVIPELLAESRSGKQTIKEYAFMMFGFGVMGLLAWND